MPYAAVAGLTTFLATPNSADAPGGMLPYDKNCVAMAFSKCLGVGVYPTINFFISKGWIARASDLENDGAIDRILGGLGMAPLYAHKPWSDVKIGMKGQRDGRYFCVNRETREADGNGHAFAIVKKGGVGIVGNNQETDAKSYNAAIKELHKISVYGPIAH